MMTSMIKFLNLMKIDYNHERERKEKKIEKKNEKIEK